MMATKSKKEDVDSLVTYLFLKKLMTPITSMDAFKMGIIDNSGHMKREPKTKAEKNAYTLLDRLIVKLKRLLGTRVSNLYNFLYLQTLGLDTYNNLIVLGNVKQRTEIKRIAKDFKRLQESHNINMDEIVGNLLVEEVADQLEQETKNESLGK